MPLALSSCGRKQMAQETEGDPLGEVNSTVLGAEEVLAPTPV